MFKLVRLNFNYNFDVDRGIQFGFNMVIIKYTVYLKLACCGSIVFCWSCHLCILSLLLLLYYCCHSGNNSSSTFIYIKSIVK